MKIFISFVLAIMLLQGCQTNENEIMKKVTSPDGTLEVMFFLTDQDQPAYRVIKSNTLIIDTSTLGFDFQKQDPIGMNMKILKAENSSADETWEMPWGEKSVVRNHYNESKSLSSGEGRRSTKV